MDFEPVDSISLKESINNIQTIVLVEPVSVIYQFLFYIVQVQTLQLNLAITQTPMHIPFKTKFTLEERQKKAQRFQQSDPDKIMVIVEKHIKSNLPDLPNCKFLAFKTFKFGQIRNIILKKIRQRMKQDLIQQSCFLFINGVSPSPVETIQSLHDKFKQKDGILYITYQQKETFYFSAFAPFSKLKPIIFKSLGMVLAALLLIFKTLRMVLATVLAVLLLCFQYPFQYCLSAVFWLNKHLLIIVICMVILNAFIYWYFDWAPYFMATFLVLQWAWETKLKRN